MMDKKVWLTVSALIYPKVVLSRLVKLLYTKLIHVLKVLRAKHLKSFFHTENVFS